MTTIVDRARAQHVAMFRAMSEGGRWHLYRAPDTDIVALMRDDAEWKWPVMVPDVQALTADMLACRIQASIRGY